MRAIITLLALATAAQAQQPPAECIPPAQLQYTQGQLAKAQTDAAILYAQAKAEIERLTKELEAKKDAKPK